MLWNIRKFMENIYFKIAYGEKGATAVEYGLIVALIAVSIVLSVTAFGGGLNGAFHNIVAKVVDAIG
ncbi:MAG: Flp family type IVb pilin [Actinobacteria bacterium]|nr:Flp family type IVb pilin [Actinomycetota bacterium]